MRCSLDKVLLDARQLANRIRATDETADILIKQASDAHNKIISKKQCQEEILSFEELNLVVKERPRSRLMICIAAENKQLELLRQDNKVLRTSLKEYETTFEMIMNKFRKHKNILKKLDQLERGDSNGSHFSSKFSTCDCKRSSGNRIISLCAKVSELKRSIEKALVVDNKVTHDLTEIETKLTLENTELRRLVEISREFQNNLPEIMNQSDNTKAQRILCTKNNLPMDLMKEKSTVVNGVTKDHHKSLSSTTYPKIISSTTTSKNMVSKTHPKVVNHNLQLYPLNHSDNVFDDSFTRLSDDDDDHSSVASDVSVKTLI